MKLLTIDEAAAAIADGQKIRMAPHGTSGDNPVLIVWRDEDGGIMSESIGGWSAGVVEPVCGSGSDFLTREYLRGSMAIATRQEVAICLALRDRSPMMLGVPVAVWSAHDQHLLKVLIVALAIGAIIGAIQMAVRAWRDGGAS